MEWLTDNPWVAWVGVALILAAIEAATVDFVFVMFAGERSPVRWPPPSEATSPSR